MTSMTRREVLQRVGILLGGSMSAGVVTAVLEGCRGPGAGSFTARTLTPTQAELVAEIAERILPATDTPGAKDAGVAEFIDLLLTDWLDDADRDRFLAGLGELDNEARRRFGASFLELDAERQLALLEPLDLAAAERRVAAAEAHEEIDEMPFFGLMKEMTLVGYYTSEVGMRKELHYQGFLGYFEGCVPVTEKA
jgi:glucoside 3-dehydrogenase (cytochrome c) hitch-hiker subunit